MANYLVRVELHNVKPDENPYKQLHTAMEAQGFSRTISIAGVQHWLPHGSYSLPSFNGSAQAAYDRAAKAASAVTNVIKGTFGIVVSSLDVGWVGGLKRVA